MLLHIFLYFLQSVLYTRRLMHSQLQHQDSLSSTVYFITVCLVVYFGPIPGSHDPKQNVRSEVESSCQIRLKKKTKQHLIIELTIQNQIINDI